MLFGRVNIYWYWGAKKICRQMLHCLQVQCSFLVHCSIKRGCEFHVHNIFILKRSVFCYVYSSWLFMLWFECCLLYKVICCWTKMYIFNFIQNCLWFMKLRTNFPRGVYCNARLTLRHDHEINFFYKISVWNLNKMLQKM